MQRYTKLEILKFLWQQRVIGFDPPGEPYLKGEALPRFKEEVAKSRLYLEFGSGGSTRYASKLGKRGLSVEPDRYFAKVVRKAIGPDSSVKVLSANVSPNKPWGYPMLKGPRQQARWLRFIEAPFAELKDEFPDFVLVDGRFRAASALETARRAQLAGARCTIMIDDYISRPRYAVVASLLGEPEMAGRAALFRVDDATPPVPRAKVEELAKDPR